MKGIKHARRMVTNSSLRSQKQKAERQAQILEAALKEFRTNGYAATRLEDVARQAGIAKGTIYLYFTDKEQLFRAVIRSLVPSGFDVLSGTPSGPARELLRDLLTHMYGLVVKNERARSVIRMLIAESGKFPQLADIHYREVVRPGMKAIRQVIQRGIASGEFRQTNAAQFPQVVIAPGILATMWKLLFAERHPLDLDAFLQAHVEFTLLALEKGQG